MQSPEVPAETSPLAPKPSPLGTGKKKGGLAMRMGTISQIFSMTKSNERPWLMPMMVLLALLGLVLSGLQAIEYVAPFIYAIF